MRSARTLGGLRISEPFRTSPSKPRKRRNGFSIHAYTGSNGGGKTMAAVYDSLPALAAGRPIVSTCRILDPTTGEPHPLWVPLDDPRVLLELGFCDVILDEVSGVADSRDSAGMPTAVLNHLQQLRKVDCVIRWTTPDWKRGDVGIRRVTQGITTCSGFAKSEQVVITDDGLERRWAPKRGFIWRTYDAKNFDEWSTAKERSPSRQHRIRPVARQVMWGPGLLAREFYDTYETAIAWAHVSESGSCMHCGGKRSPRRCVCDHSHEVDHLIYPDALDGVCLECNRKRKVSPTCDCAPQVKADPSAGMLAWRRVHAERLERIARARGTLEPQQDFPLDRESSPGSPDDFLSFPETDDTPGVVVQLTSN